MYLVQEQDYVPGAFCFVGDALQAFFELPAVLRAGDYPRHVDGDNALRLHFLRHLAHVYGLSQAFHDGGFADASLANQDGIVLRAPRQNLDDALDFLLAPDYRVELSHAGEFRQVASVGVESRRLLLFLALFLRLLFVVFVVLLVLVLLICAVAGALRPGGFEAVQGHAGVEEKLGRSVLAFRENRCDYMLCADFGSLAGL